MNVSGCSSFVFHPFHAKHSFATKTLALITHLALAIMTGGLSLMLPIAAYCLDSSQTKQMITHVQKEELLKAKLLDHLGRLETLAETGSWEHIQAHTHHPDSAFDWWMFPSDQPSRAYGAFYQMNAADIAKLKKDKEFMRAYRKGVCLVAKSWGWDLERRQSIANDKQYWSCYTIRLEKMLYSLHLFGQDDLRAALSQFILQEKIHLDAWAASCLLRSAL